MTDIWVCEISIGAVRAEGILALIRWGFQQERKDLSAYTFSVTVGNDTVTEGKGSEQVRVAITEERLRLGRELAELWQRHNALHDEKAAVYDRWEKEGRIPKLTVLDKEINDIKFWQQTPKELERIMEVYNQQLAAVRKEIDARQAAFEQTEVSNLSKLPSAHILTVPFAFCFSQRELDADPPAVREELMSTFVPAEGGELCAGSYYARVDPATISIDAWGRESILANSGRVREAIVQLCKSLKAKRAVITHTSYDASERKKLDKQIYPVR